MAGTHLRVRLVTAGMVASDLLQGRPDARMSCIEVGRRQTGMGLVVDHLALAEGLTRRDIDDLRVAWGKSYGLPATPAGAPFALRLPLPLSKVTTPGVAQLHQVAIPGVTVVGHVLQGGVCDLWIDCKDPHVAEALAKSLRDILSSELVGASVAVGDPSVADKDCWEALRLAADLVQTA